MQYTDLCGTFQDVEAIGVAVIGWIFPNELQIGQTGQLLTISFYRFCEEKIKV